MSEVSPASDYPQEAQDAFDRVGQPSEVCVGSPTNAYVGIFLGTLGLLAGIAGTIFIIVFVISEGFDSKLIRALAIPFVGVMGWYGLKKGLENRYVRIYVCEKGLVQHRSQSLVVYPYEEIDEIKQDKVKDGLDENGAPFMKRGTTFLIRRKDGAEIGIDENTIKKPLTFGRTLYKITRAYNIPWNLVTA